MIESYEQFYYYSYLMDLNPLRTTDYGYSTVVVGPL